MQKLNDKIVWISGASAGIGEAIALECARQGASLVLSARRREELERVAALSGLKDDRVLILEMDIREFSKARELSSIVIEKFGRIDYLFNNAGMSARALAEETPLDIDSKLMDINYLGHVALTKAVLPHMIENGFGHIVVTSSVAGKFGTPLRSAYAAPKHALHGFFNSLREEVYPRNIDITIIVPGYIKTDISVNAMTSSGAKFNKMSKFQAVGMEPSVLAGKVIRDVLKKKREVYYGGREIMGIYLSRFFPGLLYRKLRKMQQNNTFEA